MSESPSWAQVFAALDVDDSGSVSLDELLYFGKECEAYWADWTHESVVELACAAEGADSLALTEFSTFCEAAAPWGATDAVRTFVEAGLKRRALLDPFDPARVEAAFHALDIDDSGYIELPELLHFGAAIGAGWSQSACEALLGKMDTDGDHKISLSEFEGFMSEVGLHGCHEEVAAFIEAGEARRKLADPYDKSQVHGTRLAATHRPASLEVVWLPWLICMRTHRSGGPRVPCARHRRLRLHRAPRAPPFRRRHWRGLVAIGVRGLAWQDGHRRRPQDLAVGV